MDMEQAAEMERNYLEAVFAWLDARIEREVERWQLAGQDPSDRFRGLRVTDADALALAKRGAGSHWGSGICLPEEEENRLKAAQSAALDQMQQIEQAAEKHGLVLRFKALSEPFDLSGFEWWAFAICLAPALDLRYERIYGYLQDDITRVHPSVDLILNLLLPEGLERLEYLKVFDRSAALRTFRLIIPVEEPGKQASVLRQAFQAAPSVVAWLLGDYSPSELGERAELLLPDPEEDETDFFGVKDMPSPEVFTRLCPLISLNGSDLLRQEWAARQFAAALERPLLKVALQAEDASDAGTPGLSAADSSALEALDRLYPAVRDARMLNALLYVQGMDIFIDRDNCLLPAAFAALRLLGDGALLSSKQPFKFHDEMSGNDYPLMQVTFDPLSASDRADLWAAALDSLADTLPQKDLAVLAGQFVLTSGQILAAASTAMSQAVQAGRALQMADLYKAACFHSGQHLAELAQKIEPRYTWNDLVLPETPLTMLHEMLNMVKSRRVVLEDWGLREKLTASGGVSALFTGPPGTGKTLAAQIIANELGIDLYRIDLSTIVSKYVGETEKNLERIFKEAQTSNAILFFDEADAIFGKRSEVKDAQDRYANIEVGYLLQRMEAYTGVAILATNLRANLDEAFTRRLQFIVTFPFPDEDYRLKIWEVLMPPGLPRASDLDLKLMARRFKLAGGSIRNIIVSAAYLAADNGGCVSMQHLLHGARRELQKMGKLLQEADFVLRENQ